MDERLINIITIIISIIITSRMAAGVISRMELP